MKTIFTGGFLAAAILLACVSAAFADAPQLPDWIIKSHLSWQPPPGGVVQDGKAAIIIAHTIFVSQWPENAARIGSEQDWLSNMQATLRNGLWEVTGKPEELPAGYAKVGGGLFIYIDQQDGRVVGIFLTQ